MVVDILLGILGTTGKLVIQTCLVVEGHVLCRTQILGELLGKVPARVGVRRNLKTVHLAALGGNHDGTLGTLGTIEYDSLCSLQEGDLLNLRGQHVVGRTLYAIDNHERHVAVVVIVKTLIVHTPKVVAVPSADKSVHVFQTAHRVVFLRQLFHVNVGNSSEKMIGINVAESNMDFLFCHGRICVVSSLGIDRQWRYSKHGKEKYVSFYMFHNLYQLSIINYQLITNPDSGGILHKDRCHRQEAGTSNALNQSGG